MDADRLLEGLDPAQLRAVTTPTHPLAILAGAGSGKTRVLTRRIAHRCAIGDADARHVMAVTFTRRAASQLDERLGALGLRDLPATGTFHALAYSQLRTRWAGSGKAAPTLLDRKGRFLGRILGNTRRVSASDLATEIEWAKAQMISPDRYADAVHREQRRVPVDPERIAEWYRRYEADKRSRGVIDFDDLLVHCAEAVERDPTFAAAQHWRFRHLFVDEYQDVNPLQERLLRAWLGDRTDLCVVGDPNQAIYRWNGADPRLLLHFERDHPGAEVVELRDSYRSTPQILAVAASVLAAGNGPLRPANAHRTDGPVPSVVGYESDVDEANGIARAIRENHQPGRSWSSQAVLVRTNAQTAVIEAALRRAAIPYRVRGGQPFLDDPNVKDLLGRFDRMNEPLSTTIEDLANGVARGRAELLSEQAEDDEAEPGFSPELPDTAVGRRIAAHEQVVALGRELLATDPHATTDSFSGWLRTMLRDDRPDGSPAVTLASFHAAKGLEWDVVHVAGVEAGYLPISHARTPEARDEEQRLFYVAITRAARVLRCTWAASRSFGAEPVSRSPSPYLKWVRETTEALKRAESAAPDPGPNLDRSRSALHADDEPADEHQLRSAVARELRDWRAEQGRRAGVRPTVILSDKALDALARERPTTPEELDGLPGLGLLARERHGARLLEITGRPHAIRDHPGLQRSR